LLLLAIPAGVSFSGCSRNPGADYCNGQGFGMKITDVAAITLQPATTGISLAYGQTHSVGAPSLVTCKGTTANGGTISWGTTDRQLVDISPSGNICAGSWNRNTGGGIANYTICSPPNPMPSTNGLPYATAFITASAETVVSNPVEVFVHAQVTSISLVGPQSCLSQGKQATLDAQACVVDNNNQQVLMCAPSSVTSSASPTLACPLPLVNGKQVPLASIPSCTASIGTLNYSVGNSNIAAVVTDTTTNRVTITANQPGTTTITASVAQSGSSAGYFSTCPPKSISVTLANGQTQGTVTRGITQNLVTTVTDTNGNPITGLSLDYQSTDPIDISASSSGSITTAFPGVASVYAICQPSSCNPSPIDKIGLFGTGLPISSNKVTITTPGTASDYVWFGAPGQSQYIVPVELLTGTVGSTVRLPYVPNSMVMDQMGTSIYFGSAHELMTVSVANGSLVKEDTNYPGVVLAVSPNGSEQLINDQVRGVFYINGTTGQAATFGGMGAAAAWTPDSKTLYITDSASLGAGHSNTLYVFNDNTGWSSCTAGSTSACAGAFNGAKSLALTIPSVGAFLSGNPTVSRTWCPTGTVADYNSMTFYPQGDSLSVQTDVLAATTDGKHILGAAVTGSAITLNDIGVNVSPAQCSLSAPLTTGPTLDATLPVAVNAVTAIDQVVTSPQSNLAFITYTNNGSTTGASLPYYVPGSGSIQSVALTGNSAITAPVAGTFTPDDKLFFVSTAGDNKIHYISIPAAVTPSTPPIDTQQISPNLPACRPVIDAGCTLTTPTSNPVPATVIVVKPRSTT
jgi:sugar lactone lactonase YvrE